MDLYQECVSAFPHSRLDVEPTACRLQAANACRRPSAHARDRDRIRPQSPALRPQSLSHLRHRCSAKLLELAAKQRPRKLFLLQASAETAPFESGAFDTVVTTWSLCTIPDVLAALREMRRLLRPEGRLLFVEHGLAADRAVGGVSMLQKTLLGVVAALVSTISPNAHAPIPTLTSTPKPISSQSCQKWTARQDADTLEMWAKVCLNGEWQLLNGSEDHPLTITLRNNKFTFEAPDLSCELTELQTQGNGSITANSKCNGEDYTAYAKETLTVASGSGHVFG
jgi:SAM-dependent methyltransferase